jgi:AraC-like DNA-binding protein
MSEKQKARYQRDGVSEAQLKRLDEARKKVAHHLASKETKRKMRESALRRIHTSLLEREIIEAKVIKLLNDKSISYSKISQSVGLSIATIATISKRFGLLRGMGTLPEGYKHPKTAAPR